jgi:PKD repeat protein
LTVTFADASTGDPVLWIYSFGDGFTSREKNTMHTYHTPGTYTVTLAVMKLENGVLVRNTTVKQDLITVGREPGSGLAANFTATPLGGNAPLSVTFTDTSTGEPTYWSYTFGDGTTSSSKNPTHTYLVPGQYTVKLTVLKLDRGTLIRNTTVHHDLINVA